MARILLSTPDGQQAVDLRDQNSLGRHPSNSIQLLDKIVSKEHCRIERRANGFVLRDLGSLNGTYINGERVNGEQDLHHNDDIALGSTRGRFDDGSGRPVAPPAPYGAPIQPPGQPTAGWGSPPSAALPSLNMAPVPSHAQPASHVQAPPSMGYPQPYSHGPHGPTAPFAQTPALAPNSPIPPNVPPMAPLAANAPPGPLGTMAMPQFAPGQTRVGVDFERSFALDRDANRRHAEGLFADRSAADEPAAAVRRLRALAPVARAVARNRARTRPAQPAQQDLWRPSSSSCAPTAA
ncbi:MAG: FHA domain-containing protein [Polyangiaceae bacterium]